MTAMRGVIGQRAMLERLGARASRGDVAHAYGLFGPRSIGKKTIAIRLAQTLNCLALAGMAADPALPDACGRCAACTRIARNVHPDVLIVAPHCFNKGDFITTDLSFLDVRFGFRAVEFPDGFAGELVTVGL